MNETKYRNGFLPSNFILSIDLDTNTGATKKRKTVGINLNAGKHINKNVNNIYIPWSKLIGTGSLML